MNICEECPLKAKLLEFFNTYKERRIEQFPSQSTKRRLEKAEVEVIASIEEIGDGKEKVQDKRSTTQMEEGAKAGGNYETRYLQEDCRIGCETRSEESTGSCRSCVLAGSKV